MERGEIDGYPSAFYNSLMATPADLDQEKKVKMLVQIGAEKEKAIDVCAVRARILPRMTPIVS